MIFVCPVCRGKLNIEPTRAVCPAGHSFDKSRRGYYNLLVGRGGAHGDNKEMVLARREFLAAGHYEPLACLIASRVAELLSDGGTVLDAGCGEGYYTLAVKRETEKLGVRIAAFDISKDAVAEASKKLSAHEYAVCGSYHMPISDGSIDLLLNTFSPLAIEETRRVIKPQGYFVMAIPAEEHLFGLKSAIYEKPYKNIVDDTALEGFELLSRDELRYELRLDGNGVRSLFMMTPYAYRTRPADRDRVLAMHSLSTEVHFLLLVYRRL